MCQDDANLDDIALDPLTKGRTFTETSPAIRPFTASIRDTGPKATTSTPTCAIGAIQGWT